MTWIILTLQLSWIQPTPHVAIPVEFPTEDICLKTVEELSKYLTGEFKKQYICVQGRLGDKR